MSVHVCSPREERFNTVTHALGLAASVAILPLLVRAAANSGDGLVVLGVIVFGITLACAYGASTMYHSVQPGPLKELWRSVDCCAVFLLIAGTYTPFALGPLRGFWGTTLLVAVWSGALLGVYAKMRLGRRYPRASNFAYLGLGWLVVIAINPFIDAIGWEGFRWVLAGGLAYTIGIIFVAWQHKIKFGHCAWHLFVLAGSACHAIAISTYGTRLPQ
jgi:hemolysin III